MTDNGGSDQGATVGLVRSGGISYPSWLGMSPSLLMQDGRLLSRVVPVSNSQLYPEAQKAGAPNTCREAVLFHSGSTCPQSLKPLGVGTRPLLCLLQEHQCPCQGDTAMLMISGVSSSAVIRRKASAIRLCPCGTKIPKYVSVGFRLALTPSRDLGAHSRFGFHSLPLPPQLTSSCFPGCDQNRS